MSLTVLLSVFSIYLNSHGIQLAPWISWENPHYDFCRVEFVPSVNWRSIPALNTSVEQTRWLFPLSAFLFFALFDFASEAQKQYRSLFRSCHKALLCRKNQEKLTRVDNVLISKYQSISSPGWLSVSEVAYNFDQV